MATVLEYKCPCCGAGLAFGENTQNMKCAYCDNEFTMEAVKAYNDSLLDGDGSPFVMQEERTAQWSQEEQDAMRVFTCPSCGGQIISDENTAATFCPYCESPTILQERLSGGLKPDALIPFKLSKQDAQAAFLKLCKGKPLLPKLFTKKQRVEKITGVYVPFWLYDCNSDMDAQYHATRVHHWSDSNYNYTRTEHFMLTRDASAAFEGIPMDGSSKMDDALMESIEPFDYSQMIEFDAAYLSGFFADKYDVEANDGQQRVKERVGRSMDDLLQPTFAGYASVVAARKQVGVTQGKARYVLFPVWLLNTRYNDNIYTFAMNGQTGKMTGKFPICPKRSAAWFAGIWAGVSLIAWLVQLLLR